MDGLLYLACLHCSSRARFSAFSCRISSQSYDSRPTDEGSKGTNARTDPVGDFVADEIHARAAVAILLSCHSQFDQGLLVCADERQDDRNVQELGLYLEWLSPSARCRFRLRESPLQSRSE